MIILLLFINLIYSTSYFKIVNDILALYLYLASLSIIILITS